MQARYLVKSAGIPQIQMILPRDGMQHMHLVVALGRLGCRGITQMYIAALVSLHVIFEQSACQCLHHLTRAGVHGSMKTTPPSSSEISA